MAVSAAGFVEKFKEFDEINTELPETVARALTAAQAYCSAAVWGDRYEDGVYCKAAHLLALTGFGENARIKGTTKTIYGQQFQEMLTALPLRLMVSGGLP